MAFRATFLAVVGVTLAGHIVALGFEIAAAARFGTGREADALAFALTLLVTVTAEVVGWISTLFVPLYVGARATNPDAAAALFRRTLVALLAVTVVGSGLLALATPVAIATLAPALGARGVAVLRAFAPLLCILPVAGLFAATLQAHGRFVAPSARHLAWYGGGLAGVVLGGAALGAVAVPLGMLAGATVFAAALAAALARAPSSTRRRADFTSARRRRGLGGRSEPPISSVPSLARMGTLLVPLVILSAAATLNVAVERALAARLPEGSLAALTYGYRLLHFPLALFVANATAMLLPSLAGHAVRGDAAALQALTSRALRLAVVFTVPLAALALALAEPLTQVLLERGAFTATSTSITATAITWYAPSVVAMAIAQILFRAYQALHALWPLAWTVMAGIAVNILLMATLTPWLGLRGLPLAASLSGIALVALMLIGLRGRAGALATALVTRSTAAVIGAGVVAGGAAWAARGLGGGTAPAALVMGIVAGVAVYAGALAALAPAEARAALAMLVPARGPSA